MGGCVDGWVDYCVGQWVVSCQITRNSIIGKLIKIIQFCLKVFVFCLHSHPIPPTQPPIPLDYTQICNNSISLESIEIIQFYLKIWILWRLLHPWLGEWFDGWVKGWSHIKLLIINKSQPNWDNSILFEDFCFMKTPPPILHTQQSTSLGYT